MGMRGYLRQIAPAELEQLQRNSESVKEIVHGKAKADPGKMLAVLQRTQKIALDARASGGLDDPAEKERVRAQILKELAGVDIGVGVVDGPTSNGLNLEKSWHVLHYLLTGEAKEAPPPMGNAILGAGRSARTLAMGRRGFLLRNRCTRSQPHWHRLPRMI
jgi:hypothetical protein